MARLRLFAGLRELAGASSVEVDGDTVGRVLDSATARFGAQFARRLATAKIWLNGKPAALDDAVAPSDEIALIPPVSGGAGLMITTEGVGMIVMAAALLLTNALAGDAWFIAAVVGVGALWVWDIAGESGPWQPFRVPALLAVLASVVCTYGFEVADLEPAARGLGLGVGGGFALVASLVGGIMSPRHRTLVSLATTAIISMVAALAVGSLVLTRITWGRNLVWVFLALVIVGRGVATVLARSRGSSFDPLTGAVLATVLTGVISSLIWDQPVFASFLVAILVAIGLVAGSTLGSITRVGEVFLTDKVEGPLSGLDGPVLAATLFAPFLALLL